MIKISHECPLSLLPMSIIWNDYDYALVHLFEKYPDYYKFYENSVKTKRHVLLDNSLFELGEAFNPTEYVKWINKLNPTEYIIPDALGDKNKTIELFNNFIKNYSKDITKETKAIGVVQGSSYEDIVECYKTLNDSGFCSKIAFAFIGDAYTKAFPHPNKWVSMAMGRVLVLSKLLNDGVINKNLPHHLLGSSHPREFSFYQGSEFNWIDTLDTSSPIVHGLKKIKYNEQVGTWNKESTKLVDLLETKIDNVQFNIIENNIKQFKLYVNGK